MNDRLPLAWIERNQALLAAVRQQSTARKSRYNAQYSKQRRASDPAFRLLCNLRCRLRSAVKCSAKLPRRSTLALLGCSVDELRAHLQSLFLPGMSWDNYGSAWEIDHVIPCASFDLTGHEGRALCFQKSNLQPLWKADNRAKSSKIDGRKVLRFGLA